MIVVGGHGRSVWSGAMADQPEDEDFAALFAASEAAAGKSARRRPKPGDQVSGRVISIGNDSVFVDLGGKAEGIVERGEVSDRDGKLMVAIGDTVDARVVDDAGGAIKLRVKLGRGPEARAELAQAAELGIPVEGTITEAVKGGVVVDVAGARAFCPASQLDTRFVDDLAVFIGQRHTFLITRYESGPRGNLVVSRRGLLEAEQAKKAEQLRGKLVVGATVTGTVVSLKPYGAFVDLGGVEAMLHVSELGHSRVGRPEDVLAVGQQVECLIVKIEPAEKKGDRDRIGLSLKALTADPWLDATRNLSEGAHVRGKVTRMQPFGAFVEIAPGVEGLIHVSEMVTGKRINHPKEVVSVGQEVVASVKSIDTDKRRLSLSMSAAERDHATAADAQAIAEQKQHAPAKLGTFADLLGKKK
jgi:small subunit ribosomal protein S1